jgi:hypothetical protein
MLLPAEGVVIEDSDATALKCVRRPFYVASILTRDTRSRASIAAAAGAPKKNPTARWHTTIANPRLVIKTISGVN